MQTQQTIQNKLKQKRPLIMGVLNVTPDSFSDGGLYVKTDQALKQIEHMLEAGADIIDIGGESTRPNAEPVSVAEEQKRVVPIIEQAYKAFAPYISIDSSKVEVMRAAVEAGASMINDVNALQNLGCVEYAASTQADICLMHMQGKPENMQVRPHYNSVLDEVTDFLLERASVCIEAGIAKNRIVLDPGFGFGKRLEHNVTLFKEIQHILSLKYPLLVGVSRKTMLGELLNGRPVEERQIASVAAAIKAVHYGADIIRVHDVKETCDAITIWSQL